jgi:hypothetical protein
MMNEVPRGFAGTYFHDLSTVPEADLAVTIEEAYVPSLMSPSALQDPGSFDATNYAAVTAIGLNPVRQFLARFTQSKDVADTSVRELYSLYSDARQRIETFSDVVGLILNQDASGSPDLSTLLLNYLVLGECKTRLGETIALPSDDSKDKPLDTLLGVLRIISEDQWNNRHKTFLPWLADNESDSAAQYKTWEIRAGSLGDTLAGALGRAAAVGATSLLSPFIKLPDEVTIAVSFIAGVQGRKMAELKMHQYLLENPGVLQQS